jgi:hypothetical protein
LLLRNPCFQKASLFCEKLETEKPLKKIPNLYQIHQSLLQTENNLKLTGITCFVGKYSD